MPSDLESRLRQSDTPDPGEAYWRDFPSRVTRRIREALPASTQPPIPGVRPRFRLPTFAWAGGLALLIAGAFLALQPTHPALPDTDRLVLCFDEADNLFPGRLRSIVEDRDGLRMDLAEASTLVGRPRVYLEICGPSGCSRFVTSSGQQIAIGDLAHDVLVDGDGDVLVAGPQVLWSSANPHRPAAGFRIEARVLEPRS